MGAIFLKKVMRDHSEPRFSGRSTLRAYRFHHVKNCDIGANFTASEQGFGFGVISLLRNSVRKLEMEVPG